MIKVKIKGVIHDCPVRDVDGADSSFFRWKDFKPVAAVNAVDLSSSIKSKGVSSDAYNGKSLDLDKLWATVDWYPEQKSLPSQGWLCIVSGRKDIASYLDEFPIEEG